MFARRFFARPHLRIATRQLRTTSFRYASQQPNMQELEQLMQSDPKLRDMMEKLARRPSALAAIQNIGQIAQSKGLEPGKVPSNMDMMKLMMDKEFRDAAQKLNEEMKEAGVELNPETMSKMMGGN